MNEKYYVIAGTHNEFKEFCHRKLTELIKDGKTVSLSNFVCVTDPIQLKGIYSPHGWLIGTWRTRENIKAILKTLIINQHNGIPDTLYNILEEVLG